MITKNILNRIDHELAALNRRYATLAAGLKTPGVDTEVIKAMMEKVSGQKMELERQLEFVK